MCVWAGSEVPLQRGVWPRPLVAGDTVAVTAPAGAFDERLIAPAADVLTAAGFNVMVMPHAIGRSGSYSAPASDRWADLREALLRPDVAAVMCARGGYGATHLLGHLDALLSAGEFTPRWLIGFSDISALHAVMSRHGIVSAHASMLRGIVRDGSPTEGDTRRLIALLSGKPELLLFEADVRNRRGVAEGVLAGGNLSVLSALLGTPYNILRQGTILFIEDINEPIYKIERIFWQLRHSGVLGQLGGMLVGEFTGTAPDSNHAHVYDMIARMVEPYGYPVAYGLPVGHGPANAPMAESAWVTLDIGEHETRLVTHIM